MLKNYELTALASRVYDVRGQMAVALQSIETMKELTELVKAGLVVSLENLQEELEDIESRLTPPPVSSGEVAMVYREGNVVEFRRVA